MKQAQSFTLSGHKNGVYISDIVAVVVLYKMRVENCVTLSTLNLSATSLSAKLDVIVYDNSPYPQNISNSNLYTHLNLTYYHDVSNPGVSKAYNYAASQAVKDRRKFILLLDQDTRFPENSLSTYIKALDDFSDYKLFCPILRTPKGIYSPINYIFRRGVILKDVKPGIYSLTHKSALNSGLLVDLSAYISAGGYNEKIELYFSDFDFINRFKKKYKEMVVLDIQCKHSISDIDKADFSSAIGRFKHYVNGSYNSIFSFKDYIYLFVTIFLRSVKLSMQYKKVDFIYIFFKKYLG